MHGNHLQEVRANTHLSLVCGRGRWEGLYRRDAGVECLAGAQGDSVMDRYLGTRCIPSVAMVETAGGLSFSPDISLTVRVNNGPQLLKTIEMAEQIETKASNKTRAKTAIPQNCVDNRFGLG